MKVHDEIPLLIDLESGIHQAGHQTWDFFHRMPIQGALTSGAIGLYAVTVFGVAELMAAGLCAYLSYRIFVYGEPLLEALEKTIKFEKGELPYREIPTRKHAA